jgi:tetratricopeptide (TPR) repeat protein
MIRILYMISLFMMPFAGYSQTVNKKAMEDFLNGSENVIRKNYKGAVADLSWAIKRDSGFLQAYENRGVAKFYLQDYRGAIDDYTKALEINPNDYNTFGRRGWAKFYLQDCNGAIADFTKAIEGSLDAVQYYNARGQAKYYLQDYKGAMADFNRVIKFWSGDRNQRSKAFFWRGLVKIKLGQKDSGCLDLNKAGKLGYTEAFKVSGIYCQ